MSSSNSPCAVLLAAALAACGAAFAEAVRDGDDFRDAGVVRE